MISILFTLLRFTVHPRTLSFVLNAPSALQKNVYFVIVWILILNDNSYINENSIKLVKHIVQVVFILIYFHSRLIY